MASGGWRSDRRPGDRGARAAAPVSAVSRRDESRVVPQFLQLIFTGVTIGATYALAALGFSIIYNASGVINFAQGEFIMLGGMIAAFLAAVGAPLPLAVVGAVAATALVGLRRRQDRHRAGARRRRDHARHHHHRRSMILRGGVETTLGKGGRALPPFSGDKPIAIAGATVLAAEPVGDGDDARRRGGAGAVLRAHPAGQGHSRHRPQSPRRASSSASTRAACCRLSFVLSAALGALGGVLIAPIANASYDAGIMLGLKGFVAAAIGGLGSGVGAVAGGLALGLMESLTAGYLSSAYKDAVAIVVVLADSAGPPERPVRRGDAAARRERDDGRRPAIRSLVPRADARLRRGARRCCR